jgi:CRISPR-associated endonuclease Cas1
MQSHVSATFSQLNCPGGVCVVDGYGAQVRISRRQLVVSDGIGRFRRERVFPKALADIERLVILGHEGVVTFEALRWLNDAGIAFLQIDRDGQVIASSAKSGLNDPRLRRALARAPESASGLGIARYVLSEKIAGQQAVLRRREFSESAADALTPALEMARNAETMRDLLTAESSAAADYWGAWEGAELRFARNDEKRIPAHWRRFRQRRSPLTGSQRIAVNPANAILNYLYALLEAETRLACLTCGLDPGLGIFHADQKARDSLALDLMEAGRPQVDAYLLDLAARRIFAAGDFVETRKGSCRILAPVTHILAETSPLWARAIAPVVEETCRILTRDTKEAGKSFPTLLTQDNRRAAHNPRAKSDEGILTLPLLPVTTCPSCGGPLPNSGRSVCDDCLPERRQENAAALAESGPAALARMRAEGRDPMDRPEARRKVGAANAKRKREAAEWERTNEKPDPEVFTREILPLLENVPLTQMERATGLSKRSCSRIKHGWVPHAMHWARLLSAGPGPARCL